MGFAKRYFLHKAFVNSLRQLRRAGGRNAAAAREVEALIGRISQGEENPFDGMKQTKHGESRIANCIKYDLTGFARLVTALYGNLQILLFVGTHERVDAWLDSHKGMTFGADGAGSIVEIGVSRVEQEGTEMQIVRKPDIYHGPILSRLPRNSLQILLDRLTGSEVYNLQQLQVGATPEMIRAYADMISDPPLRMVVFDVLTQLNAGDVDSAERRIGLMTGEVRILDQLSPEELLDVRDGESTKQIPIGSEEYQVWINNYIRNSTYHDWFLFMHPEQEAYVTADYPGPAKLSGVSGSGKTCIAVRRAIRLAQVDESAKVAIVTLNRSLAELIKTLVDYATNGQPIVRTRIRVTSLFALCQELLNEFEPHNSRLYADVTWKLEEHIDEVFREYYRLANNFTAAEVLLPLHRQLVSNGINAEAYIRDEFDWLRSVLPVNSREAYLEVERAGRGVPLNRDRRESILVGLRGWEDKMASVGVVDYLGLTTALSKHIDKIEPRFTSIIVDEVQDFGTTELAILRRLAPRGPNDLFCCGDLAQHILPKHLVFQDAGVDIAGRSFTIRRNYRNSREILRAAYQVLYNNLDEAMLKQSELELLDPEYANRSSAAPVVCWAKSLEDEIRAAMRLIKDNEEIWADEGRAHPHRGCIAIAGYSFYEISIFGQQHGIPVLDGSVGLKEGTLFLSDLEQTKGYEFDTMIILNCAAEVLPPKDAPESEAFRYGCQLYVAMTRARDQLVLSYSGEPSPWFRAKGVELTFHDWNDYVDMDNALSIGVPGYLPQRIDADDDDMMSLTGQEFLFTPYALGMKADTQEKLAELVSGRNLMRGRDRVEWKNVGLLLDDLTYGRERGRTGYIFGPAADLEVRNALERARSGLRPIARKPGKKVPENTIPSENIRKDPRKRTEQVGPTKAPLEEMGIRYLDLEPRTFTTLHEMKVRTVGDVLALGFLGLSRNPHLRRSQIEEIRVAVRKLGRRLPEGDVEQPRRRG